MATEIILSLCDYSGEWSKPYIRAEPSRAEPSRCVVRVDPKHGDIDQAGRGLTPGALNTGLVRRMDDGGVGLGMTAGALADLLETRGLPGLAAVLGLRGPLEVIGVLAAPPCTDFSVSGARWWAAKDLDGRTTASVAIVEDCLRVIDACSPRWWVLENPVGRIAKLVPRLGKAKLLFHPCDYAGHAPDPDVEAYTKKTCLWGEFNPALDRAPREPVMYERGGKRGSWMWANLGGNSERTKALRSMTPIGFSRAFAAANC